MVLQVNDKTLTVPGKVTLLELCRSAGIDIPTLCEHGALAPYGACRLCTVEIVKDSQARLDTACTRFAEDGMVVYTDSERVVKLRKTILELLLARCPGVEAIRELASGYGLRGTRLPLSGSGEECILCGRCVRVCREVIGKSAIGFAYRGTDRKVATPFHVHSGDCIGCFACAAVCPTGAVKTVEGVSESRIENWNTALRLLACEQCSRPFMPLRLAEEIAKSAPPPGKREKLCPDCRRRTALQVLADYASPE